MTDVHSCLSLLYTSSSIIREHNDIFWKNNIPPGERRTIVGLIAEATITFKTSARHLGENGSNRCLYADDMGANREDAQIVHRNAKKYRRYSRSSVTETVNAASLPEEHPVQNSRARGYPETQMVPATPRHDRVSRRVHH